MSVVERALKKIQKAAGGQESIARVSNFGTEGEEQKPPPVDLESSRSIRHFLEFDLDALSRAGLYSGKNNKLSDQYRLIKRTILKKAGDREQIPLSNLVMVTSALSGEGKTFTSVNLSLSMANEKDWSILLVDVDCRNPSLSRLLGVVEQPGLLDYLRDPKAEIAPLVLTTNIEGLSVLPVGTVAADSTELLGSARMRNLCKTLSEKFPHQIIVFDSSPLLLSSESPILSGQVGQISFVVDAHHSPRHTVLEALDKIDHEKVIGLILNRLDDRADTTVYGAGAYGPYSAYQHG
jgi:exopolysaccharide/PEP-CTERM locus tyrosine autokinase